MSTIDILTQEGIEAALAKSLQGGVAIHVLQKTTSTNAVIEKYIPDDFPLTSIVITGEQTEGKGRRGKSFYSPKNTGVYLSIAKKCQNPSEALFHTVHAALAVSDAIRTETQGSVSIKWPNDVYIDNKKVCGILTETRKIQLTENELFSIVGIGINVYQPEELLPDPLKEKLTFVRFSKIDGLRDRIAAQTINGFLYYCKREHAEIIELLRQQSVLEGKAVRVIKNDGIEYCAVVIGITDNLQLEVKTNAGKIERLTNEEVSISGVNTPPL